MGEPIRTSEGRRGGAGHRRRTCREPGAQSPSAKRAAAQMASTSEKDQLEGRCYGVMQVVSLVCGTTFGVLPVVGTYAIVSFLTILVIV